MLRFDAISRAPRVVEDDGAGGTVFDAIGGDFLETVGEGVMKWRGDLDVESASHEGQAERFGGLFGDMNADAAEDALARLEDDMGGMTLLVKEAALSGESIRVCAVEFGVVLEVAAALGAAVAVKTTGGFAPGLVGGESRVWTTGGHSARDRAGRFEEELELGGLEAAHDARESFFEWADRETDEELVEAFGGSLPFAHGADEKLDRFHGAARGEDVGMFGLSRGGVHAHANG
jgi:hypothetical protein